MNIAILLSGVILANKEPNKVALENITGIKVIEQYKIIPSEVVLRDKELIAKKVATSKKTTKKKKSTVINGQKKKKVKKSTVKKTKKKASKKVYMNAGGSKAEIQAYAHSLVLSYGWSEYDYECLVKLWNRESGWNPNAVNKRSGACGVPQSLPCSKMKSEGSDYRTNYKTQVRWGLKYIKARYGSPANAWGHSQQKGWY